MVKLTISLIKKRNCKQQCNKSSTKETENNYLKKLTHLLMNEQNIDEINNFSTCTNLRVIYLQRNCISEIKNLNFAKNLTHLYLQHNQISKIENLDRLIKLRKLYLGYNKIAVIEGLENLINLSVLHIENQKLDSEINLSFEPRTLQTLSECLVDLNISDTQIISLKDIRNFKKLVILRAQNNLISDIEDLTETISSLSQLEELSLQGNPVTRVCRYRENLIANSDLITLDEKSITDNSRTFLKRFKYERLNQSKRKPEEFTLSDDITNSLNLPPAFVSSISRAMFKNPQFSFPGISTLGDTDSQILPPWKSAVSIKSLKNNQVLPRPFWKNKTNKQKI